MASAKSSFDISENGEEVFEKRHPMPLVRKKKIEPAGSTSTSTTPTSTSTPTTTSIIPFIQTAPSSPITTQSTHTYKKDAYPTYQTTTDDDDYQPTVVVAGNTSKPSIIVVSGPAGQPISTAEEQTSMGYHQKITEVDKRRTTPRQKCVTLRSLPI
ncbi:19771_t:CDS:2 [Gigaspora margarita]|uniref:19771_t:CDS:1 n=1 Tax=Gigaspora margarita TaxID=4874 RepID=A0ABN7USF8_GIGMA|nr:19771_t:CDS:2 [Gigaspora margarita]